MEYFKYTRTFLNSVEFEQSDYTKLDSFLNGTVKSYLAGNYGFINPAPSDEELQELTDDLKACYSDMLLNVVPQYEEVLRLSTPTQYTNTDTTTSKYGDEEVTGKYFEPKKDNVQQVLNTTGQKTEWNDDEVTVEREEYKTFNDNAVKEFFTDIKANVENCFIDFINPYADGSCEEFDKGFTQEQRDAINSGINAEKVQQIETNKNNISTIAGSISGIIDDVDDLNDRVTTNETNITNIDNRVDTAESDITSLDNRVDTAEDDIDDLETRVTDNEADITTIGGQILNIESDMSVVEQDITGLKNRATSDEQNITSNTNRLTQAESDIDSLESRASNLESTVATNTSNITAIQGKIPTQASSTNQLADKAFVNSTVQTGSSNFRGSYINWASVPLYDYEYPQDYTGTRTPSTNDYLVIQDASGYSAIYTGTWRFKYTGLWSTDGRNGWQPEYKVNEEPLTAQQIATLNSGFVANDKHKLDDIENYAQKNVQSDWEQDDEEADDYIKNKPTIPSGAILYGQTGQQTNGAMHQKATTDALNTLQQEINDIDGELATQQTSINNLATSKQNALNTTQLNAVNSGIDSTKVAQIETNKTNIGSHTTQLITLTNDVSTRAKTDLTNVTATRTSATETHAGKSGTKLSGKHLVIESWKANDNSMWYRKYDDGWKECGVIATLTSNEQTTNLPVTFSNTNYFALVSYSHTISQSWGDNLFIRTKQTNSITTYLPFGPGDVLYAYCCGY